MRWLSKAIGGKGPRDRTEEVLIDHLDQDFIVFPMAEASATEASVEAIGRSVGVRYPPEFVAHVCGKFPGAYIAAKDAVWPRPKPFDVGPFWTFLYAVHSFSPMTTSVDWMRLDLAAKQFQERSGLRAAPILRLEGDPNMFCVDAHGMVQAYDHELNQLAPVEMDFWQLLEREVADLVERKNRLVAERIKA